MASKIRKTIVIICCLTGLACSVWMHAESDVRRKARYYYSAGLQSQAVGNLDAAYEYFKKAAQVDPSYEEGALAYGIRRLYNNIDTLQTMTELENSLRMMRPYVDKYPEDTYESLNYGYVAGQLGLTEEGVEILERAYRLRPSVSSLLLQLSDVYAHAYKLPEAVEAIDRYESQEGLNTAVTTRKLSYLLAAEDTVRALQEGMKLIKSDPKDASYRILMGNIYEIIERPDSALKYYLEAEQLDPDSGAPKLALAGYYRQTNDSVNYDKKIYEVLLTEDFEMDQKIDMLADYLQTLLLDNRDSSRGDYLFSVLRSQYPHQPRLLDLSARYAAAKGNLKEAEEEISYAIDLDPTNSVYWGQLMTYQAAGDEPTKAFETFDKASKHITPDFNMKFSLGAIAQMVKDYDRALGIYKGMIADIDPALRVDTLISLSDVRRDISMSELDRLSDLFVSLGDIYHQKENRDSTYLEYENAITLNYRNNMAKNNYAYFLSIEGGDFDKALAMSAEVINSDQGDNPTYIDTYAWINYLKGDLEAAEQYQSRAVEIMDGQTYQSSEIYDHYGDILRDLGRTDEAVKAWQKAIDIMKDNDQTSDAEYEEILLKINQTLPLIEKNKE